MGRRMVKVSVELRSDKEARRVCVQAESIRKALDMMGARYPSGEAGVVFPIEPEGFSVDGPATLAGMLEPERTKRSAPLLTSLSVVQVTSFGGGPDVRRLSLVMLCAL
jgi:hypothetical protein